MPASAIVVEDLKKIYRNQLTALKGISFTVQQGDFFGLLGPNGAGKSTAIGIFTTLVNKTSGKVILNGFDLDVHPEQAKKSVGLVPQEFNFNVFERVLDVLVNQAGYYGIVRKLALQRAEHYLEQLGIWDKRNEPCRNLSGGMKRRFMIVRALLHEPQILILDEPTAGVDIELRRSMWAFLTELNAKGRTILLTTHYLEEAEQLCRNIAIIHGGEMIENTSTKNLIKTLDLEVFILDLVHPLERAPQLSQFECTLLEPTSLEIKVHATQNISQVFEALGNMGIQVKSLRNKTNRLEEQFLNIITLHGGSSHA